MKVLVLCDDIWHPARVPKTGLAKIKSIFTFDWIESALDWSAERMSEYPLVLLAKSNNVSSSDQSAWMTDNVQAAFVDYVRKGNGLLAVHSGTADYENTPLLRGLMGGVFAHHPEQSPVTMLPTKGHRFSNEIDTFTLQDEHYFMHIDDPDNDVFLTTKSKHGEQPGGWNRTEGNGRVAVLTPGHNLEVWLHPSFQALLINALRWCGKLT